MIFGKYQLLELIGTGGMAEIFKAKSYGVEGFEKLLVIKRILSLYSDNEDFVEMFVNEAKIAVSLNHANIVQIYDLGKAGESYFMAMEYVHGMDLAEILDWSIRNDKPIPLEAAIHIICEVAKGLDYAHRKKDQEGTPLDIIHRDISPQNILISAEGEVKITDFGIAKAMNFVDSGDNDPIKGKFAYMAPEQAIAAPHDKRVDIFSSGIMFYELLTGINPLRGHTPAEMLKLIQSDDFPDCTVPCAGGSDQIPIDLEPIIRKAVAADPEVRFESAAELYEALLTFSYMEGLRAGAGALAEFLAPILAEKEQTPRTSTIPARPSIVSRVSPMHEDHGKVTSVRLPSDAELAQMGENNAIQLTAAIRDVALLTVSWNAKGADSKKIQKNVESFGGVMLEKEESMLIFGFGVQVASDALRTAADTAFHTCNALKRDPAFKTDGAFGISIHLAALSVESNGNVKLNTDYKNAVAWCVDISNVKKSAVVFENILLPLMTRWYDCGIIVDDEFDNLHQIQEQLKDPPPKSKLVGRRDELKIFGELLATVNQKKGAVLALTGPAGVGKTRILTEVKRRLTAGGHSVMWLDIRCSPWNKKQPYSSILSLFRTMLDIAPLEPTESMQKKLAALDEHQLPPAEAAAVKKLVVTGRAAEVSPVLKSAFTRIIRHIAESSMTIVAVDHLTAIDDESLDLLHALSHSISDVPVLLTVAIRLGYIHGFEGSPIFTQLNISPLSDAEMQQLIQSNISTPSVRLVKDIFAVSANIPKFAEEYIYELQHKGVLKISENETIYTPRELRCPTVIRDIISSELHSLPRDRRTILQLASCLGEQVDADILSLLLNKPLDDLEPVLQMLMKVKLLSQKDSNNYEFPTPFIQEAVYYSIDQKDRLLIHRTIAQKIEQEYPKELDKYAEQLAIHYLKSNSKKAAYDYLITAAQNRSIALDYESSVKYYLLALDLTLAGLGSVSKFDIFEQLALMAPQTKQVNTVLTQAILLKSEIDAESAGAALSLEAQEALLLAHVGEYDTACQQLTDVVSSQQGEKQKISKRYLAQALIESGEIAEATAILAQLCDGIDEENDPYANAYYTVCLALCGETEKALQKIENHTPSSSVAPISMLYLSAEGHCLFMEQSYELAIEAYTTALSFAEEQYLIRDAAQLQHYIAVCHLELENFKSAFEHLRESISISTDLQYNGLRDRTQVCLSYIDAVKFNSMEALNQMVEIDSGLSDLETQVITNYYLAKMFLRLKKAAKAKPYLAKTKELQEQARNHFYLNQVKLLEA
ncbi:MAG: protein kinase [Deltaproteobacteria bacterium]|nr:protein kinase [Deltaproteobacteria bacterium]MBN2670904.1 protein kinase [Deltaproteobacteria bacterium]